MDVTFVACIQRHRAHTAEEIFVGVQSAQSAMCGYAITAKCKYDKNRCLPAEVLHGDSVMDAGLLGAHLDVKVLIIEDHHSHQLSFGLMQRTKESFTTSHLQRPQNHTHTLKHTHTDWIWCIAKWFCSKRTDGDNYEYEGSMRCGF